MAIPDRLTSPPSQQAPEDGIKPLSGRQIVVTRPAEQAGHLSAQISLAGGVAVLFPVLAIHDIDDPRPLLDIAARLDEFDLAVFVSPNAVNKALATITRQRPWPARLRVAAMGQTSERELARFGITEVIAPRQRFDSEALLELPEMREMAGKRVVVLRGDSGRDLLGDTLVQRGATVEYVTCYRRSRPDADIAPLLQLWAQHCLDAIVITSSEGLRNFVAMLGDPGRELLLNTPLFAPHARIVAEARALGLSRVVSTAPGDEGLMAGLVAHFSPLEAEPGERSADASQAASAHHGS
ncbi:MAG: uroporphyrinogen-III synthase [Rhodocyclaceae bacterium]|nr:MAG: uroporphyrinogen-III synthase [Rhodocyclaceae bacterium]